METLRNIGQAILSRPYLAFMVGFLGMVVWGISKLLAILPSIGA